MFERFAKQARAAVVGAEQIARDAGSRSVDTRHVLVALLDERGAAYEALRECGADAEAISARARAGVRAAGLDGDALAGLGIDLDAVRRHTDAIFGRGALERAGRAPRGHIPLSPDAKQALELALREAVRLRQKTIQEGHLLLGIVRGDGPGRELLVAAGLDTAALRAVVEAQTRAA